MNFIGFACVTDLNFVTTGGRIWHKVQLADYGLLCFQIQRCQVLISNDNKSNTLYGSILGFDNEFRFNPLNVLAELRYKDDFVDLDDFYFDDFDYEQEFAFGTPLVLNDQERSQYVAVVMGIKKLLLKSYNEQSCIKLSDVELLQPFYDISFHFTPLITTRNSDSFVPDYREWHQKGLYYGSLPLDTVLEHREKLYTAYLYDCYNMSDVLFSVLHYLALSEYKINRCAHCDRYFATTNYKIQYCERLSQYPKREQYSCYEAVKRIRQDIQRKHRQIYQNLTSNYYWDQLNAFEIEFTNALDEVKAHSDYTTLDKCYEVLDKERWYRKESFRTIGKKL